MSFHHIHCRAKHVITQKEAFPDLSLRIKGARSHPFCAATEEKAGQGEGG